MPSEFSSGARRVQGPITKTGNGHARRLLVEAAWHHRRPLRATARRERAGRADGQSAAVRERAEAGNRRLHQRWCRLEQRKKWPTVSVVAVARERAGWCWSLAVLEDDHPTAA
ncbi:transposase [Actinomycetospora sp. CA-053990]|uniref:transposase n=1 Tax=Actinomycetospora sp. CA-053990 TaxID=3239891 RepID=UPI003D947E14